MALSLVATLPLVTNAQDKPIAADPANPAEAVSAPLYESAFKTYQPMAETSETSDKVWRTANDEAARIGGHMGAIKDDAAAPPNETTGAAPAAHGAHQKH